MKASCRGVSLNAFFARRAAIVALLTVLPACAAEPMTPSMPQALMNDHPLLRASGAAEQIGSGFKTPEGIAVDQSGNIYVADAGDNTVKKIAPPITGPSRGTMTTI